MHITIVEVVLSLFFAIFFVTVHMIFSSNKDITCLIFFFSLCQVRCIDFIFEYYCVLKFTEIFEFKLRGAYSQTTNFCSIFFVLSWTSVQKLRNLHFVCILTFPMVPNDPIEHVIPGLWNVKNHFM